MLLIQQIDESAKELKEVLAICAHTSDVVLPSGNLTEYGSALELYNHAEDGWNVIYYVSPETEGDYESGYIEIPGYWAVKGTNGEVCANPIAYIKVFNERRD